MAGTPRGGRAAKKSKRGHHPMKGDSVEGGDHDAVKPPPFAALLLPPSSSSGTPVEEMHDVMARTLAGHETGRIEELVARSAAAERDAQHLRTAHEDLRSRHDELERRSREESGRWGSN